MSSFDTSSLSNTGGKLGVAAAGPQTHIMGGRLNDPLTAGFSMDIHGNFYAPPAAIGYLNYPGTTHVRTWTADQQQLTSSTSPGSAVTIGALPGYTIQYAGNLSASPQTVTVAGPATSLGEFNGGGVVQLYGAMNSAGNVITQAGATLNTGNPAAPTAASISATSGVMTIAGTVNLASQGWGSITSAWQIQAGGVLNMIGSPSISGDWRPFNNTITNNGTINVVSTTATNVVYQTWSQNGFTGTGSINVFPGNAFQLDVSVKPAVSSATQTITLKGMGANPYVGTFGNAQNNGCALFVDAATNPNNVANPVVLEALTSIGGSSPANTAGGITGSISGPGGVYLSGYNGAWLTILGNNTYTGPTYIGNANSVAGQTGATGSVSFGGATGTAAGGSSQVVMNGAALQLVTAQTIKSLGSNTASGNLNLGNNPLTITNNGTTTVRNVITGSGALNVQKGTLNLTAANTMTGTTAISAGAGIGGGSLTTGRVAGLTMSAASSRLVTNVVSPTSVSRLTCSTLTTSGGPGFTLDVVGGPLNVGTYPVLTATAQFPAAPLPTIGANDTGRRLTTFWSAGGVLNIGAAAYTGNITAATATTTSAISVGASNQTITMTITPTAGTNGWAGLTGSTMTFSDPQVQFVSWKTFETNVTVGTPFTAQIVVNHVGTTAVQGTATATLKVNGV